MTCALAVVAYWWWRRDRAGVDAKTARANVAAVASVTVALALVASPWWHAATRSEVAHMGSHLTILLALAPCIVLATPSSGQRRSLLPALIEAPIPTFLAFTVAVPLDHLTSLNELVMTNAAAHVGEFVVFTAIGVSYWRHLLGPRHLRSLGQRILYVALGVPISAMLGIVLVDAPRSLHTPMADVGAAGWMMLGGSAVMALQAVGLSVRWLVRERRSSQVSLLHRPHRRRELA